ncbi:MAG: tyrosine-type recombinase/integrase [Desulfovibrio sp.]|jgi:integrase|nr:tyrosine-type recombinase/integrase [Desulfovibrio sp.]
MSYFGRRTRLDKITLEKIDGYVNSLKSQGNSGATINRKLSALSKVMRTAYERGKLQAMPIFPRMREGEHRIRFLSYEEEQNLIGALVHMGNKEQAEAVKILLYTGMRTGELWRLECRDVDLDAHTITLWKTKNGKPRTVPIVRNIIDLMSQLTSNKKDEDKVITDGGHDWLRRPWDRVRSLLGYEDDLQFVPHMLRHTCATRLSQKGVTMPIIKEWLGHTSITTTMRYTHFAQKDLFAAAALLETREEKAM